MSLCALLCALAFAAPAPPPSFEHAIVVVFENKESAQVLGSRAAPTFNAYARRYARLTRYYGVTHPSLPNYLALVSGSTHGITDDCTECSVDAPNLADTLEASGRTWKVYADGLGGPRYAKKHNPFAYFRSIASDPRRSARIVPYTQLRRDLPHLPDFALVVPDLCHDMHDCSVSTGDRWLRGFARPLLKLPRTAIFVLFDEGTTSIRGGGHVPALVIGTAVRAHARFTAVMNHYGMLRTIEDAWRLPRLGLSTSARPITGIWR